MLAEAIREIGRNVRAPLNRRGAVRRLRQFHAVPRDLEEVVASAMSLGSKGFFKVKTIQVRSEIRALAEAVAALRPKVIVELGTARGGTLFIWAHLASEKVISCDRRLNKGLRELIPLFAPAESACEVELMTGNSHDPEFQEQVCSSLGDRPVDFLFVDGDHTEAGVEADFRAYGPLVRPGGLIAFHDIVKSQPSPMNEVYYFWRRVRERAEHWEYVADRDQCGFGIGVIRVPDQPLPLFQGGEEGAGSVEPVPAGEASGL